MKKLLLCTTVALTGLAVAHPAKADGIKLDLAGHFKGYVDYISQSGDGERHFDILRETEIHFTGETTLDNGLTIGVHHEADLDNEYAGGADGFVTEESYAYFSSAWGRVNFGKEDGANYLLEVAAPSADENYDGLREYVNPFAITNYDRLGVAPGGAAPTTTEATGRGFAATNKLDYSNDGTGYSNKLTYLTPVFEGFQFGASYTPDVSNGADGLPAGGTARQPLAGAAGVEGSHAFGNVSTDTAGWGAAYEGSGRYEGQWRDFGFTAGGGYTHINRESLDGTPSAAFSDYDQWNVGANVNWTAFNVGAVYTRDNGGQQNNGKDRTFVLGGDYTTGPFKLGVSWLNNAEGLGVGTGSSAALAAGVDAGTLKTNRYAGGVVYTYGPGMTFRGSVGYDRSYVPDGVGSEHGTDALLGTQINF